METNKRDKFIEKSKSIHGNKYDYSKVEYVNNHTKVCIACPIHGEFYQTPSNHLKGRGCPKCGKLKQILNQSSNTEEFVRKAKETHGNKYDYSKVNYINNHTKVCIICPEHGEFWQAPAVHITGGGCKQCSLLKNGLKHRQNTLHFIAKAKEIHHNKYDYSCSIYTTAKSPILIVCPEHGEFWQTPDAHLSGHGCPKCANNVKTELDEFVKKANLTHGCRYDYSNVVYVNNNTKVCITCPEHGEFLQTPKSHLNGNGCPKCSSSHLEAEIRSLLTEHGIAFEEQKKFGWLGSQSVDFYIPSCQVAIECQGIQHFKPIPYFGGEDGFQNRLLRDHKKKQLCVEHGIDLLYYANYEYNFPYDVITTKEELLRHLQ